MYFFFKLRACEYVIELKTLILRACEYVIEFKTPILRACEHVIEFKNPNHAKTKNNLDLMC